MAKFHCHWFYIRIYLFATNVLYYSVTCCMWTSHSDILTGQFPIYRVDRCVAQNVSMPQSIRISIHLHYIVCKCIHNNEVLSDVQRSTWLGQMLLEFQIIIIIMHLSTRFHFTCSIEINALSATVWQINTNGVCIQRKRTTCTLHIYPSILSGFMARELSKSHGLYRNRYRQCLRWWWCWWWWWRWVDEEGYRPMMIIIIVFIRCVFIVNGVTVVRWITCWLQLRTCQPASYSIINSIHMRRINSKIKFVTDLYRHIQRARIPPICRLAQMAHAECAIHLPIRAATANRFGLAAWIEVKRWAHTHTHLSANS